jgi:hypothetical protein
MAKNFSAVPAERLAVEPGQPVERLRCLSGAAIAAAGSR